MPSTGHLETPLLPCESKLSGLPLDAPPLLWRQGPLLHPFKLSLLLRSQRSLLKSLATTHLSSKLSLLTSLEGFSLLVDGGTLKLKPLSILPIDF